MQSVFDLKRRNCHLQFVWDEEGEQQSRTRPSLPLLMRRRTFILAFALLSVSGVQLLAQMVGQPVNTSQQVLRQGLRTSAGEGSFTASAYAPDGSLYLLLDQHDGLRLLKTDAAATSILAQSSAGAAGDVGVAMSVAADGSIYVVGTSSSGALHGTSAVPYPSTADTSTNSFLAKFDANLNLLFLSFLGAGRTSAVSLAVTADSVFVTGITFNNAFPVSAAGIQQAPANGTTENGFVERFSADGTTLQYATYLTGAGGSTLPAAIVADSADDAYVTGATSANGFPTLNALQPELLPIAGHSSSGFLCRLNPAGSAFSFSTFLAGSGMTGMDLDAASSSLLLTGNVASGQFPIATVEMPLTSATYQTLLRIPTDGQSVTQSVLLTAGSSSSIRAGVSGDAWVSGTSSVPLFPGVTPPDYNAGDSYLLHVTGNGTIDQTMRFGGLPKNSFNYASLTSSVTAPAISGTTVTLAGTLTASLSASLLATQIVEFPLVQTPDALLPNTLTDLLPTAAACGTNSRCTGNGAFLAQISTAMSAAAPAISAGDLPNLTLRNLSSVSATGLTITATGYTINTNCGTVLLPSNLCNLALSGTGPGTLSVSANNAALQTLPLSSTTVTPDALVVSTEELDFGIVSAASGVATQTVTVSNLSSQQQTFLSTKDGSISAYTMAETATTCAAGPSAGQHLLAAGATCTITLGLTASGNASDDGAVLTAWTIGPRDLRITGFTQAAALNLSASEIDFGTYIADGVRLPRYLYLSNNTMSSVEHAIATLPSTSPFNIEDGCPATLQPKSVCQLVIGYVPQSTTATDSQVFTLDQGLTVLLTGNALPMQSIGAAVVNPSLSVSATQLTFATAVAVTGISSTTQPVLLSNTGSSAFPLSIALAGDFNETSNCPAVLAAAASCTALISFTPSQPGLRQGLLSITAGSGFTPQYVALSGTGTAILPASNGILSLGQTFVGEPLAWYKVQLSVPSLSINVVGSGFGVALVTDTGSGHGSLPPQAFASTATLSCGSCWLGVQYLSPAAQSASGVVSITSVNGGNPYVLAVTATSSPVQGLVFTPGTLNAGATMVGSSSGAMTFTLSNLIAPATTATIQSVSVSGDFTLATNTTGGTPCAGQLLATASCFVQVNFSPTTIGDRNGELIVTTSAGTSTAKLSGYGVASTGLAISPSALNFASVPNSSATMQTITLSNLSSSSISIGALSVSDPSFAISSDCSTLAVGATCSVIASFTPVTATVSAVLSIPTSMILNGQSLSATYTVPLFGAYTAQNAGLELLPAETNYGATSIGSVGQTIEYTLNNLSGKQLNITLAMARQFPLASAASCATLSIGASCNFSASFAPVETGLQTGTVLAQGVSIDGLTTTQALAYLQGYGSGSGALTITGGTIPYSPLMFGQVTSGQSAQQVLTLTNSGTGPLTIRRISSAPPFLSTTNCGGTLAAAASCTVTITYAPIYELSIGSAAGGTRNDAESLSIESDAITSPDLVAMTGLVLPVISSNPASSAVLATYALSNRALTFANTQVGSASTAQTLTLTNTGMTRLHVLGVLSPADFTTSSTCGTLLPGSGCSLSVRFAPTTSEAQLRTGALEIQTDATDSLEYVSLLGTSIASPLSLGATSLNFGTVLVGVSATLTVSVTNDAPSPVTFTGLSAGGAFSVTTGTCPPLGSTLAAGASCVLSVTFAPVASGLQNGTLSLTNDTTQLPLTVALAGTGLAPSLQAAPATLNYGSVTVGASSSLTLTVSNVGTSALTGLTNTLSGLNAGDFVVNVPCAATLAAGTSCVETLTFTPAATGARAASLTVGSSDPAGPLVVALNGTGAAVGTFVLTVNGGSVATVTVASGQPASYALLLGPLNGFAGNVALTCVAVHAGSYASCSLLSPLLTVNGGAVGTTATISTVSAALRIAGMTPVLLLPLLLWRRPRRRAMLLIASASLIGCGSGSTTGSGSSTTVNTPAGTYQYQVTASATGGAAISSTVTLNLVVQ